MLGLKERRIKGCLGLKDLRVKGTYRHQQQRKEEEEQQQQQRKHQEVTRLIQNLCWRTSAARPKSLGFDNTGWRPSKIPPLRNTFCKLFFLIGARPGAQNRSRSTPHDLERSR